MKSPSARVRCLLLAVVYTASVLMPATHQLLHTFHAECGAYVDAAAIGPVLAPDCHEPCCDPHHHHHPQHDDTLCPTCQWGKTFPSHLFSAALINLPVEKSIVVLNLSTRLGMTHDLHAASPRAPPFVPTL